MGKLQHQTAIVTGGAHGLGLRFAAALAREGASVAILDIADSEAAASGIGSACFGLTADVSDEASVNAAVAAVLDRTGRIDVLVNNAAVFSALPLAGLADIDVALWDKVMAVNLRGPFLMVKHVVPHMIARGYGKIINVGSGTAYRGIPWMLHYVTSKGAIIAMTRAMARELGGWNICVNTVSPGFVVTEGREVDPEYEKIRAQQRSLKRSQVENDLVGTVLFLSSAESDFMTGQLLNVDGGYHFVG